MCIIVPSADYAVSKNKTDDGIGPSTVTLSVAHVLSMTVLSPIRMPGPMCSFALSASVDIPLSGLLSKCALSVPTPAHHISTAPWQCCDECTTNLYVAILIGGLYLSSDTSLAIDLVFLSDVACAGNHMIKTCHAFEAHAKFAQR